MPASTSSSNKNEQDGAKQKFKGAGSKGLTGVKKQSERDDELLDEGRESELDELLEEEKRQKEAGASEPENAPVIDCSAIDKFDLDKGDSEKLAEQCSRDRRDGSTEKAKLPEPSKGGAKGNSRKTGDILNRIRTDEFKSSTKIEALLQELKVVQEKDPTSKSIVFSQYCNMLSLIEWRLKKAGFHCAQLNGSMHLVARGNILYAFNTDPRLKVILISLKAGGEGLNLQVANNIFLMDPWWNPAAEMQAIQRAHRIGQTKPVNAVRFICKDTIEERILHLQEKKQLVFDGTVGSSDQAIAKLTAEDLRFLFQN